MAEQLLDGADVVAAIEQMRGEAVPQDVRRDRLRNPGFARGLRHGALDDLFVQVVAANDTVERVGRAAAGRKHVLPRPAAARVGILARERERKVHLAEPFGEIPFVHQLHAREMRAQRLDQALGEHRAPVAPALAVAHRDLAALEVHVLHPQAQSFEQPHPGGVEQARGEPARTVELRQ